MDHDDNTNPDPDPEAVMRDIREFNTMFSVVPNEGYTASGNQGHMPPPPWNYPPYTGQNSGNNLIFL